MQPLARVSTQGYGNTGKHRPGPGPGPDPDRTTGARLNPQP